MPAPGDLVRVRSRQYLVEEVTPPPAAPDSPLVRLSCLEDDALGEPLQVLWDHEIDAQVFGSSSWRAIAECGFDEPRRFSAFLHTLRWNCVTSTNPKLFQAPYRAGIDVKAYQLEPLRKALLMPRVNLFIADDVGLGKSIESGLILRELLMRQKVRRVVVACPPSVVPQWREELGQRFGLTFVVLDRDYVTARRQERGFGVNPWTTHSRFIISPALLRDETYAAPLRDWLANEQSPAMLILDEAHNVAPALGSRYAVDSKLTKVARELAPLFDHKLFLSATPHNGHSNSFSALLEILDPQRFCRGVPVQAEARDAVMVRRLKKDLKEFVDDFPDRDVDPVVITGLPEDAPELVLSRMLQQYRTAREERLADQTKSQKAAAMLVITSLQKRLLSSVEAFARTLAVHRRALEASRAGPAPQPTPAQRALLVEAPGSDDALADLAEQEVEAEDDAQVAAASPHGKVASDAERALLDQMTRVAEGARFEPDAKLRHLIDWVRAQLVPDLGKADAKWLPRRVLIFTEYADTKRWLHQQLLAAIDGSDRWEERIATFHGGMGEDSREEVKAAFNADPADHPLRILIATDAAREGVNLQNHCADLFHFDVPWNPSRMEQRNGRIDRKLQRAKRVTCRHFVLPQRAEDRVLEVLVAKTKLIHEQLGSLPPVVERSLSKLLAEGIRHEQEDTIKGAIEQADRAAAFGPSTQVITEELEGVRERREQLAKQVSRLEHLLAQSREHLQLNGGHFRDALSVALQLVGAPGLEPLDKDAALRDPDGALWHVPALGESLGKDPTWSATLDALRPPMQKGESLAEWRRTAKLRPFVFKDPKSLDGSSVHLHLEHRVVQRLLGRFMAQGFLRDDLSRACVLLTEHPVPHVVALGRLSLYGDRAARLHDEVIAVAAEWKPGEARGRGKLRPLGEADKLEVLRLVDTSLGSVAMHEVPQSVRERFREHAAQDVAELVPHLQRRAQAVRDRSLRLLTERGEAEGNALAELLRSQRDRIELEQERMADVQLSFAFDKDELRQLEANQRHWKKRLSELSHSEIERESEAVRASYEVRAHRVEPAGLVYLWPVSE